MLKKLYRQYIGAIPPKHIIFAIMDNYVYPEYVTFELTNYCNLQCIMCSRKYMSRKNGFMGFGLYKKIVNEIAGKVEGVALQTSGESLFHPNFFDMVQYAKSKGIKTSVSTNATILTTKNNERLLSSGLDVLQVSIEGESKEEYEKIRCGASFEQVRSNLKGLIALRGARKKPLIDINLLLHKGTNVDAFVTTWNQYCDTIHVSIMRPLLKFQDGKTISINPSGVELYEITNKIIGCPMPFFTTVVGYDGKVSLCCADFNFNMIMGDANKDNILDIFNNKQYREIRKKFILKKYSETICNGCTYIYCNKSSIYEQQANVRRLMNATS